MPVYLVSYDITKKDAFEYKPLWDELERLKAVKTQLSEWLLSTTSSQKQVFDHFKAMLHKEDKLMITEITKRPHWQLGFQGTKAFLEKHFPQ